MSQTKNYQHSEQRRPDEFIVSEVMTQETRACILSQPAPFTLFALDKHNLATPDAVRIIAEYFGLPAAAVSIGGLKDKNAHTSQYLTLPTRGPRRPLPELASGSDWLLRRIGYLESAYNHDNVAGNRFAITETFANRDCLDAVLARIPNYELTSDLDSTTENTAPESTPDQDTDLDNTIPARADDSADTENTTKKAKLTSDQLLCNALQAEAAAGTTDAATFGDTTNGKSLVFVNYFGAQRFGSIRNNKDFAARYLVHGDYENGLKLLLQVTSHKSRDTVRKFREAIDSLWGNWPALLKVLPPGCERGAISVINNTRGDFQKAFGALPYFIRQMAVESYQSYLWNLCAAELLAENLADQENVCRQADLWYGELDFYPASVYQSWMYNLQLPLLGPSTRLVEPWKNIALDISEREGVLVKNLRLPGIDRPWFGSNPRSLLCLARNFTVSGVRPLQVAGQNQAGRKKGRPGKRQRDLERQVDKPWKCTFQFTLPKAAYATIVLQQLATE